MSYPSSRPRRMRRDGFSRRLMREHVLTANDLFLRNRCLSIAGGTTQILRNVAGERILGLPRE